MRRVHPLLKPLAQWQSAEVYLVGGCVRDWLLGRPLRDLDLVVAGPHQERTMALLRRHFGPKKIESFERFLTQRWFLENGFRLDLALPRSEVYPTPGALPVVSPAPSIEDDLGRRDFSVNAIALGLTAQCLGRLVDPWGGQKDLKAKKLRVLHGASFHDDPTRLFRLYRFSRRLGFQVETQTGTLAKEAIRHQFLQTISPERVMMEIRKALEETEWIGVLNEFHSKGLAGHWPRSLRRTPSVGRIKDPEFRFLWAVSQEVAAASPHYRLSLLPWPRLWRAALRDLKDLEGFDWSLSRTMNPLLKSYYEKMNHPYAAVFSRERSFFLSGSELAAMGLSYQRLGQVSRQLIKRVLEGKIQNKTAAKAFVQSLS